MSHILLAFGKYIVEPTFQALSDLFKVVRAEVIRDNPETVTTKPSKNVQVNMTVLHQYYVLFSGEEVVIS